MANESDSEIGDILNDLLSNNATEDNVEMAPKQSSLKQDFNFLDSSPQISNENKPVNHQSKSEVYDEAIDSSDDEDRRYFEEQKYTDYGRDIKSLLKKDTSKRNNDNCFPPAISVKSFDFNNIKTTNPTANKESTIAKDVYSDPFFGLRIVNPLVSSSELRGRMTGKTAVSISKVKYHITSDKISDDWVLAGVLINKSPTKTSQKGSSYSIWKLSDLSEEINTVCLFVFSSAYKSFWKTTVGTVVGILNPNVLESKDSTDQATLAVDNPQKIMILGKSKDMGKCKSLKKNGEPCSSIVNISRCQYCVYHVKQEYKKCSRRAELQSSTSSQNFSGDVLKLRGKQKTFKNDMNTFTPVYAVKNEKQQAKDAQRLALLSGTCKYVKNPKEVNIDSEKKKGVSVELSTQQTKKDFERLNKLRGCKSTTGISSESPINNTTQPSTVASVKLSTNNQNITEKNVSHVPFSLPGNPRLGVGCIGGKIDFSQPITKKHIDKAKMNAIKWVQENGKIKPKNPNELHIDKKERVKRGIKRHREIEDNEQKEKKKSNVLSDQFKEMMQAKSAHTELIEKSYEEEQEKYFNKLEMKEKMEEKMLTTFKVPCKAVSCLVCKYTTFSASSSCKEQNHPLRVIDAIKRFFKCTDCKNRTVSLDRIPVYSCTKCGGSNWVKTAMMDERKTSVTVSTLSLRGNEEKYIGSTIKDANLNLLVPEND